MLPEHARGHNRSLVLQTLYREGQLSRADIARETGLTRVTVSDLVSDLIGESLVIEIGQREDRAPASPQRCSTSIATAFQIIGIDLSEYAMFRGALLDLDGKILGRAEVALDGARETRRRTRSSRSIETWCAATLPILGIGVGSPGVVDLAGVVLTAPNLGWTNRSLQRDLTMRFSIPVLVINDANAAALAEHSFGGATSDMMLIKVGHGVGAGLLLAGIPLFGSRFAAGEIGHVVVGTDGGLTCACGKSAASKPGWRRRDWMLPSPRQ